MTDTVTSKTLIFLPNHALFKALQIKPNRHELSLSQLNLKEHCAIWGSQSSVVAEDSSRLESDVISLRE